MKKKIQQKNIVVLVIVCNALKLFITLMNWTELQENSEVLRVYIFFRSWQLPYFLLQFSKKIVPMEDNSWSIN